MVRRERGKRRHTPASRQMHNQARSNHTVPRHAPPANPPPGGLLLSSWRPAECAQPVPPRSRDEPPASDGWSASTRIDLSDLMPKPRGRSDVWESHASLTPAGTRVASPAPPMRRSGDATLCWEGSYQRSKISGRRSVVRTVVGGTDRVPGRAQVSGGGHRSLPYGWEDRGSDGILVVAAGRLPDEGAGQGEIAARHNQDEWRVTWARRRLLAALGP